MTTTPAPTEIDTLIATASTALTAAAERTEGATDDDSTCLKDEEACFRISPVHFAWYQLGETGVIGETKAVARVVIEAAHKPLLDELATARAELEALKTDLRISRSRCASAERIMAEDSRKLTEVRRLCDSTIWILNANDVRAVLDANPATAAEPAAPHCGLCGSEDCPGRPGTGCSPGPYETYEPGTKVTGTTQVWPDFADQCVTTHTGSTRAGNDPEPADEPKATASTVHGYTAHGHPCCGEATVGSRPASRARCGGVDMCRDCQAAAGRIHGEEPAAG